jgi:hypothetical protein
MRNARRIAVCGWLLVAALGCNKRTLPGGTGGGVLDGGTPGSGGAAGPGTAGAGAPGAGGSGAPGGAGGIAAACTGPADERLVLAEQRILRLTAAETLNTVRHLIDDAEAAALVRDGILTGAEVDESRRLFPPLQWLAVIDSAAFVRIDAVADHVAAYVLANFATVTGCAGATDACATTYLDRLAGRAYRRQPTTDERARLVALYDRLRGTQTVNGYLVTFTVEEATSYAVRALLSSPQMLWRWEIGVEGVGGVGTISLTEQELATQLAFFLTDQPPDDQLLAAANARTLRPNLAAHVDRLLAMRPTRDWLRTIMEAYLRINTLPQVALDPDLFPIFTPALASDMGTEARLFLDNALWNGNLTDLLLSRTSFHNTSLAPDIYAIPPPAGATSTTFAPTTLPADQRSGLLTNAAFLTAGSRPDGHGLVALRGSIVSATVLCMPAMGPCTRGPDYPLPMQTAEEQVLLRAKQPGCRACHAQFDAYGLALASYDNLGRFRTVDEYGLPIDPSAKLPDAIGGGEAAGAVDLAQKLAATPAFTNCMARTLLQYAMSDGAVAVEVPLPPQQAGCATAEVVARYQSGGGRAFADLVRATVAAPAFAIRRAAP